MKIQVIGSGAAGNKAVIEAVRNGVISEDDYLLINSTPKDINEKFREKAFILSPNAFGCAKETSAAQKLTLDAITEGRLNLENWVDPDTNIIVIAVSTDGGTGSGSAPIIADYISTQLSVQVRVHIVAFNGFDDDVKGLRNTVDFYKKLSPDYTIQVIDNRKFLKDANDNKLKAEQLANVEFCQRMVVLQGSCILESDNNIDDADLLKTGLTPGFMNIEFREFPDKIRNTTEFNKFLNELCDATKSFDISTPSQKRMAVVVNLNNNKTNQDAIDWSFKSLINRFGNVKELFIHKQLSNQPEFIAFISAGMVIPKESIADIYQQYKQLNAQISKEQDSFFGSVEFELDEDEDDILYKEPKNNVGKSSSFFAKSNVVAKNDKFKDTSNKVVTKVEDEY